MFLHVVTLALCAVSTRANVAERLMRYQGNLRATLGRRRLGQGQDGVCDAANRVTHALDNRKEAVKPSGFEGIRIYETTGGGFKIDHGTEPEALQFKDEYFISLRGFLTVDVENEVVGYSAKYNEIDKQKAQNIIKFLEEIKNGKYKIRGTDRGSIPKIITRLKTCNYVEQAKPVGELDRYINGRQSVPAWQRTMFGKNSFSSTKASCRSAKYSDNSPVAEPPAPSDDMPGNILPIQPASDAAVPGATVFNGRGSNPKVLEPEGSPSSDQSAEDKGEVNYENPIKMGEESHEEDESADVDLAGQGEKNASADYQPKSIFHDEGVLNGGGSPVHNSDYESNVPGAPGFPDAEHSESVVHTADNARVDANPPISPFADQENTEQSRNEKENIFCACCKKKEECCKQTHSSCSGVKHDARNATTTCFCKMFWKTFKAAWAKPSKHGSANTKGSHPPNRGASR